MRQSSMSRAQRFKRMFRIDIETCQACGGAVRIIASIEDPAVIRNILAYLDQAEPDSDVSRLAAPRARPTGGVDGVRAGVSEFT